MTQAGQEPAAPAIEFDAAEARRWMVAVSQRRDAIAADEATGIFGDHVSLLDFDPDDLERVRALSELTRLAHHDQLESAIAIAGSSAQGRVQLFPGDNDFFERAHVRAPTAVAAEQILRDVMRETALRALVQPDIVLTEANLGTYDQDTIVKGKLRHAGDPMTWTSADIAAGEIEGVLADGSVRTVRWDETPIAGWVYLEWIVADRAEGRLAQASNMIDVTWEDAAGTVRSFDGAVDPLCQEIYLEAEDLPLVTRLAEHVDPDARGTYAAAMREQVINYAIVEPNYGKAAKRLYNLFRLTDELEAAAYIRELFDEPAARLYQVPTLLYAADVAVDPASGIDRDTVHQHIDFIIESVRTTLDGRDEAELVAALGELRVIASEGAATGESWSSVLERVDRRCAAITNEFFRSRLMAMPAIETFVASLEPQT